MNIIHKLGIFITITTLCIITLTGCNLANEQDANNKEKNEKIYAGIAVSTEELIGQNKIYAKKEQRVDENGESSPTLVFDNKNITGVFNWTRTTESGKTCGDRYWDDIMDITEASFSSTESNFEGTLHLDKNWFEANGNDKDKLFYFYDVYQEGDKVFIDVSNVKDIFVVNGTVSEQSQSFCIENKTNDEVINKVSVKINLKIEKVADKYEFVYLDKNKAKIGEETYTQDMNSNEIKIDKNCETVLIKTIHDGNVTEIRYLYLNKDEEHTASLLFKSDIDIYLCNNELEFVK